MSPAEDVPAAVIRMGFLAIRKIALVLLRNSFKARNDFVAAMITELWMESLKTATHLRHIMLWLILNVRCWED